MTRKLRVFAKTFRTFAQLRFAYIVNLRTLIIIKDCANCRLCCIFYLNSNEITENIGFDWLNWSFVPSYGLLSTRKFLATESIQNLACSFQRIDNIKRSNSFTLCMFGISHSITNDVLQKNTKNTASFFGLVQDLGSKKPKTPFW